MAKNKKRKSQMKVKKFFTFILLFTIVNVICFLLTLAGLQVLKQNEVESPDQQVEEDAFYSKQDFIDSLVATAQKNQKRYGILPSISLAQAILESDWGRSDLAKKSKNLYGIKGSDNDPYYATQEHVDGEFINIEDHFREYETYEDSMVDHAQLLIKGTNYQSDLYHDVLYASDYVEAAHALQKAGYATDPDYGNKLIRIIEEYKLYQFD